MLALDNCVDVSNMGALVRTATCLGVDAVLISEGSCDPFYRRAVRTSMGHVFSVPIVRCDLPKALRLIAAEGGKRVATVCDADATPLSEIVEDRSVVDSGVWDRWVCVMGNEHTGVSDSVLEECDVRARIPMPSGVDSLNINVAAALFLYELGRTNLNLNPSL